MFVPAQRIAIMLIIFLILINLSFFGCKLFTPVFYFTLKFTLNSLSSFYIQLHSFSKSRIK